MSDTATQRILANSDIREIELSVPAGHQHLRAVIRTATGEELVLQEATVASLVRAYISVKTHPIRTSCRLTGRRLEDAERKSGFADWQLLE